jgi:coenzyme F420 hydrogenase subunit beta
MVKSIFSIIRYNLCISCGLCSLNGNAQMIYKNGVYKPSFKNKLLDEDSRYLYDICPGKGYPIIELSKGYTDAKKHDYRIGKYLSLGAATSKDIDLLKDSSSGALIPTLANYLLDKKYVDGIITVKYEYTLDGPIPKPFIAKNKRELQESQGSKYQPIPLLEIINEIISFQGTLAVIGTPCQIAGVKLIQTKNNHLKEKIKYTISNFCGGFRDYRETERIFKIVNINKAKIEKFSYRGNGQPGFMSIQQSNRPLVQLKYPEYSLLTGYIKHKRCRLCIDATGELADISFGDAWIPKYLNSHLKWSEYIVRSKEMKEIIEQLYVEKKIVVESITKKELIDSQKGNIITKKERQFSRYKLYSILGIRIPFFDGGYNYEKTNLKLELKVLLSHYFMYILEKFGLYLPIAKLLKRVKK